MAAQSNSIGGGRRQHERRIVDELLAHVAGDGADMRLNAEHLRTLLTARGFRVEVTDGPGSPLSTPHSTRPIRVEC